MIPQGLAAVIKAHKERAKKDAAADRARPAVEKHTCALAGGGTVAYDVPDTKRH